MPASTPPVLMLLWATVLELVSRLKLPVICSVTSTCCCQGRGARGCLPTVALTDCVPGFDAGGALALDWDQSGAARRKTSMAAERDHKRVFRIIEVALKNSFVRKNQTTGIEIYSKAGIGRRCRFAQRQAQPAIDIAGYTWPASNLSTSHAPHRPLRFACQASLSINDHQADSG